MHVQSCFSFFLNKLNLLLLWRSRCRRRGVVAKAPLIESFRFWDKDDFEYEIFSTLSINHVWTSVILAGKRDSSRHSTTSFSENVEVAREQIINCKKFYHSAIGRGLNFVQYK